MRRAIKFSKLVWKNICYLDFSNVLSRIQCIFFSLSQITVRVCTVLHLSYAFLCSIISKCFGYKIILTVLKTLSPRVRVQKGPITLESTKIKIQIREQSCWNNSAYKQRALVGTRSPVDGRAGGHAPHLYTKTAPVHIQGMEWGTGGPVGYLETPGILGLCLQGTVCQSTQCGWTRSPIMCAYICTPVSMSGRQARVLEHPCSASAPSAVDPLCDLWRQVELWAVATSSTSLSSNEMPLLLSCSGVPGIEAVH